MAEKEVRVGAIERAQADEAAEVLAEAFAEYPFLVRAFAGAQRPLPEMMRHLFWFAVQYRLATGIPVFAAWAGDRIVGAATVRPPDAPPLPEELKRGWEEVDSQISDDGHRVFSAYDEVQEESSPKVPHLYLVAVGVLQEWRSRGVGRGLVEAAQRYASTIPGCCGVALDTHDEANVPKYERMGFRVTARRDVLGLANWYMWDQPEEGCPSGARER